MLLDSNIVIYAAQTQHSALLQFIRQEPRAVSIVSRIEVLGFHRISARERQICEAFFLTVEMLRLSDRIVDIAVELRQQRRMGLGDAIIAATALEHNLTLITRNTRDFRWIEGLDLQDPMEQQEQT